MDLATGAMGSLLPKLAALCKEEYKLTKGMRQDIQYLSDEMQSMKAALSRFAEVPLDQLNPVAKIWAREVKELSYVMDDVFDSFLIFPEVSKPANLTAFKGRMKKFANLLKKGKTHRAFANALNDFKFRVMENAERRMRYELDDVVAYSASVTTAIDPRLTAVYQDAKGIIGIDGSRDDLVNMIMYQDDNSSKQPLKILSIVGPGGVGKTTLAKAVYDKLKSTFDCQAFVSVGRQPNLKRTLRDLLFQAGAERYQDLSSRDERELIHELRMLLKNKRYLMVVDDIWDIQAWEIIQLALVSNDCGSSVIITTRNVEVAKKAGVVYMVKPLSMEDSKRLLHTRIWGKEIMPHEVAEVTYSILKKCRGLPLYIITMASLMAGKPWGEWSKLYESIVGFENEDDWDINGVRKILLFSYYDLPSHLRTCLLHLSIFPEGYMIKKDTLIWKWIAEGFVHERQGIGLFEVGENYFNELINRSLVQPVESPRSGIIIGCHVDILILDMINNLSKEENFVTVLDSHKQDTSDQHQARLLAIQNRVVEENEMLANPHVRSFNATKCEFQMMPSHTNFQHLRVLALEDCAAIGGIYHLEHISKLVLLRYLGLFNTPIFELPEGIGNLQFLQTLDLRQTKIEELPHGIVLLRKLKCLRAGTRSLTVPDGMGNLSSLEELQLSDVSSSGNLVKELGKLTELRDLKLWIRLSDERLKRDLVESLGNLHKIEILHLDGGLWTEESYWEGYVPPLRLRHVFLGMKFSRLPTWINPSLLPILSNLSVDVSVVEEEDLLILGSFSELVSLSLVGEYEWLPDIVGGGAFPSLKYCYTSGMVRFLKGAAPRLESFSFNVRLWGSKDGSFELDFRSLRDHPLLQEVRVEIFYTASHVTEWGEVEAALRDVVHTHPNSPILDISKWKSCVSEQFGSHYDVDGNDYYDDNEQDNDHEYYYDEE